MGEKSKQGEQEKVDDGFNCCDGCDNPVEKDGNFCGKCKFEMEVFGGFLQDD